MNKDGTVTDEQGARLWIDLNEAVDNGHSEIPMYVLKNCLAKWTKLRGKEECQTT
jgi:hypothetical protein